MKTHRLKIDHVPLKAIILGTKTAEFRRDDREFEIGDMLMLQTPVPEGWPSGVQVDAVITHIQKGYGIPEGYAMLSIKVVTIFNY